MFENVDGGRRTDARVTDILKAHLGAFGSGELKIENNSPTHIMSIYSTSQSKT